MRKKIRPEQFDIHCWFSSEDLAKIERLRIARSPRPEEQKVVKVLRDAVDLLYATKFGDDPLT